MVKTWASYLWFVLPFLIPLVLLRLKRRRDRRNHKGSIGIFHPYCNAGGGGERVLWATVQVIQDRFPDMDVVIYTGDVDASPEVILSKVSSSLKINLSKEARFVYLHQRKWVESSRYPFFTLLGQSLGSLILGMEALIKFTPDFFIDTMGYAFTYPLFSIVCGSKVACYTHYPTISTDMLTVVSSSTESFNNRPVIAKSSVLTQLKLFYYRMFAMMYGLVGRFSDLIMVNSSWTRQHIKDVWSLGDERVHLLYPPCDTQAFQSLSLEHKTRNWLISVAQFRPEKNHAMQLTAFKRYLELTPSKGSRLVLVGSCRNQEDEERVRRLQSLSKDLDLQDKVMIACMPVSHSSVDNIFCCKNHSSFSKPVYAGASFSLTHFYLLCLFNIFSG